MRVTEKDHRKGEFRKNEELNTPIEISKTCNASSSGVD